MKTRALLLCLALAGAWLALRPAPPPSPPLPRRVADAPEPQTDPPTVHEGRRLWRADDEIHVLHEPGASPSLPDAQVIYRNDVETTLRLPPGKAADLRGRPGVREIRPVFYASPMDRSEPGRRILTRQVAVTLSPGADVHAIAARHGVRVALRLEALPHTWVLEAPSPEGALAVAEALRGEALPYVAPQFARLHSLKGARRFVPNDTLFPNQWHLQNTGQSGGTAGEDVGAVPAWDVAKGLGVVVGIIDDGLQHTHPDLLPNYRSDLSIDIFGNDSDPAPGNGDDHGTAVSGVAAARGENGVGVAGAAYLAQLAGLRLTSGAVSDAQEAQAFGHQLDAIFVKNNSWGPADTGAVLEGPGPLAAAAIQNAATAGRSGKGVVFVWAGGNGGDSARDNVNFDGYANNRFVIAVGAVGDDGVRSFYSEPGAPLLVVAPSSNSVTGITTTDRTGNRGYNPNPPNPDYPDQAYTNTFGGTSSAAPLGAGVVALVLSANPNLAVRDVKHVLVRTARTNDSGDPDWSTNGAGFTINHNYGHGVLDAGAAVNLAGQWARVGPEAAPLTATGSPGLAIPDSPGPTGTSGGAVTHTLTLPASPALRVEMVEVVFNATHTFRGDLRVSLTAPSGTVSRLADYRPDPGADFAAWVFTTARCWGEGAAGNWTLAVEDMASVDTGTFDSWTIRVYGSVVDTTAPVAGAVNDGPGADIDAQADTTTIRANWSGFSEPQSPVDGIVYSWAIGTAGNLESVQAFAPLGYLTSASRTGLSLAVGTTVFVTVRATNFEGLTTEVTSDGVLIQPDTTPPAQPAPPDLAAASDTGSSSTDDLTSDTTPTLTGTTEPGAAVQLFDGATPILSTTADGTGAWSLTPTLAEGSHSLTVVATDAAGNPSAASNPLVVTLDTTPPSPPASAPDLDASSDSGTSSSDDLTNDTTPLVTGAAPAGTTVTVFAGATPVGTGTAAAGTYSITTSALANGPQTLTATATDAAGNSSGASPGLAVAIDIVAPAGPSAPDLAAASDSGVTTDNITNDATPTFSGTAEANATVTLYAGATAVGTGTATGGAWLITSPARPDGTATFTARATDAAGNTGVPSGGLDVTIDTAIATPGAPDLVPGSDTGASNSDNVTGDTTPTFSGTTEANAAVTLYADATPVGSATANGAGAYTVTASTLAPATYLFKVSATDVAGNASADSATLSVVIDTSAPPTPAAPDLAAGSDSGSSSTDNVTTDTTPTFTGTVGAGSTVTLYDGATAVGSATANGAGVYSVTSSPRPAGVRAFAITETNLAGNTSAASPSLGVTIDTSIATPAAPDLAAASDTGASATDSVTSDATPTFSGTTEAGAAVALLAGASTVAGTTADGAGAWTLTAPAQAAGTQTWTVQSTDPAGNVSAASPGLAVTIDTTGPGAGSVNDGAGADVDVQASLSIIEANWSGFADAESAVSFEWAIGSGATPESVMAFTSVGAATSASQSGLSLSNGVTYYVTVRATNLAGLQAVAASDGVTISAPTAPTITSSAVATGTAGVLYVYDVNATGNPVPAYALTVAPSGMSIDAASGVIRWLPTAAQKGSNSVTVSAANGVVPDAVQTFTVTVGTSASGDPPVAVAGPDATGNPGGYLLDGSGSSDPEGGVLTFSWTEAPGNPTVGRLKSATSAIATFTGAEPGAYLLKLSVTDPTGLVGEDWLVVTILDIPPVADAGPDGAVAVGAALMLDGRGSADGNGTPLTYLWSESPSNPSAGTLTGGASATPVFSSAVPGTYLLTLEVSDGVASDADTLRIDVVKGAAPSVAPPTADAGPDQTVFLPATVQMNGGGSVDADSSGPLTFVWTEDPANPATGLLSSPTAAAPTFTPSLPGRYVFSLVVLDSADDGLASAPDSTTVWATSAADVLPSAAGSSSFVDLDFDGRVDVGETVTLSGASSADPEGAALTYVWSQVTGPEVSSTASGSSSSFTPALAGTYEFQLVVTDAGGQASPPVKIVIHVVPDPGTGAPVAVARANGAAGTVRLTVLPGDPPVALDGSLSQDNDGDGFPLRFRWERVEGPVAAISGADSSAASFTPLRAGTCIFRLQVTDSGGLWDRDSVTVIVDTFDAVVNPGGNGVPTAVLQPVADVPAGTAVTLDGTASSDPADGDAVTDAASGLLFEFRQVSGPASAISAGAPGTATVTPATPGLYVFELVVSDGQAQSAPATVSVNVTSPSAPPPPARRKKKKRCGATGLEFLVPAVLLLGWRRHRSRS